MSPGEDATTTLTDDMIGYPEKFGVATLWKRQGEVVLWEMSFIVVVGFVQRRQGVVGGIVLDELRAGVGVDVLGKEPDEGRDGDDKEDEETTASFRDARGGVCVWHVEGEDVWRVGR